MSVDLYPGSLILATGAATTCVVCRKWTSHETFGVLTRSNLHKRWYRGIYQINTWGEAVGWDSLAAGWEGWAAPSAPGSSCCRSLRW